MAAIDARGDDVVLRLEDNERSLMLTVFTDLAALLALFLGDHAHTLDAATLAHLVVRRRHADLRADLRTSPNPPTPTHPALPRVAPTRCSIRRSCASGPSAWAT